MVGASTSTLYVQDIVSVLALSSRFDGHGTLGRGQTTIRCFSTRSVESF